MPQLMNRTPCDARQTIVAAISDYLALVEGEPMSEAPRLARLAEALDQLVMAYHATAEADPDTEEVSQAPIVDEGPLLDKLSANFPELDWYPIADPEGSERRKVVLSMAAGDLVEIAADLIDILWLFEHAGENDAIWEFRFGYQHHWGRHLHEIRPYLHSLSAW